jgi:peroxiredoxin Q/BCP
LFFHHTRVHDPGLRRARSPARLRADRGGRAWRLARPRQKVGEFDEKYGLDFSLLADEDHAVAEAYGVWAEKSRYGRKYWGVGRTTFVIGPDGVSQQVFRRVKPAAHDELVLAALAAR